MAAWFVMIEASFGSGIGAGGRGGSGAARPVSGNGGSGGRARLPAASGAAATNLYAT